MKNYSSKYAAQRKDPRWQKKRLERLSACGFKCQDCDDGSTSLNIHHLYYIKDRDVWAYPDFSLVCLCEDCHSLRHERMLSGDPEFQSTSNWEIFTDALAGDEAEDMTSAYDLIDMVQSLEERGHSKYECRKAMLDGLVSFFLSRYEFKEIPISQSHWFPTRFIP